jgi:hypothetical protein
MKAGNFKVSYDGESLSAAIKVRASLASKSLLYALNILLLAIIVLFTMGGIGVIVLFIVAFEVLFLRYTLWNLYGSETFTLRKKTLSYQLSYGLIKLPIKTLPIYRSIRVIPFHEDFKKGSKAMKLIFESFDERGEAVNLYQTALVISQDDYELFMESFIHFNESVNA